MSFVAICTWSDGCQIGLLTASCATAAADAGPAEEGAAAGPSARPAKEASQARPLPAQVRRETEEQKRFTAPPRIIETVRAALTQLRGFTEQ
jgi:hypothetical protein